MDLNSSWIDAWDERMREKFGKYPGEGPAIDWLQALCFHQYGDPKENPWPPSPSNDDISVAMRWEAGDMPASVRGTEE